MQALKQQVVDLLYMGVYEANHYHGFTYERLLHITFSAANPS